MLTLIAFLGSAGVRLALGHLFDFITKWQDQKNELARMTLQGALDADQHKRNLEAIELQAKLGIQVVEAQTQSHVTQAEADAFVEAVKATGQKTGILVVDLWNGIIRPLLATVAIVLWGYSLFERHGVLNDWDRELMAMVLGVFIGGRIHSTGR